LKRFSLKRRISFKDPFPQRLREPNSNSNKSPSSCSQKNRKKNVSHPSFPLSLPLSNGDHQYLSQHALQDPLRQVPQTPQSQPQRRLRIAFLGSRPTTISRRRLRPSGSQRSWSWVANPTARALSSKPSLGNRRLLILQMVHDPSPLNPAAASRFSFLCALLSNGNRWRFGEKWKDNGNWIYLCDSCFQQLK